MTAKWIGVLAVAAINVAGWSQSQLQDSFAITADQVARAVSTGGIEVAGEQVFPACQRGRESTVSRSDVLSVEPFSDRWFGGRSGTHSWVKLGCRQPGACLPFYAVVSRPRKPAGRATHTFDRFYLLKLKPKGDLHAGRRARNLVMDDAGPISRSPS